MPETTVFDHYEVLRREDGSLFELGRGAMGITYKAFDTSLRCPVALKVINAASIHSDVARQRFVREARAAAQLRHRHVASVFHLGVEGDTYFYAMEFIEGETVESFVRRSGPIKPILALRIALQVTRALTAAQKHQLVHRDIKPSNLMLVHEDDELVVKVIDFGLAKSRQCDEGSSTGVTISGFVGTPHFASPEQLDELDLDVRSDIYSLGVTLWYMLAGEAPFSGTLAQVMNHHLHTPPPIERLSSLPQPVRDLLLRMLAKDPAQRPQTPADLRVLLDSSIELLAAAEPAGSDPGASVVLLPETARSSSTVLKSKGFYAGAIVANHYELLRDLGEGNCGWAFQAEDVHDGSKLRLLVLQADWAEDPAALTQIEREVEKLRALEHPNILRVLGIERTSEAGIILLEWTEGFTLLELLRSRQEIDADETLLLLRQIAAGVDEAASRSFRHLDFSLGQILIHFPNEEKEHERHLSTPVDHWPQFLVKINPLGITREFATSDTWAGGQTIVGDLAAAPHDPSGVPARHYIQSLAAVVYELLGGSLSPVMIGGLGTQPVPRYVPVAALPEAGNEVVRKAFDPKRAYATATEFYTALEATLAGDYRAQFTPSTTTPPTPGPPQPRTATPTLFHKSLAPQPPAKPGRTLPWLAIIALSVSILAALALWFINRSASEPQPTTSAGSSPTPIPTATPTPALASNSPAASPSLLSSVTASSSPLPPLSPVQNSSPSSSSLASATTSSSSPLPPLPPVQNSSPPPPLPVKNPAPSTPLDPAAAMKAKLQEGASFESAQDWPKAIEIYLDFTRSYPAVDSGRKRLDTLLATLAPSFEAMPPDKFAPLRPAVTDAAAADSVPAMLILAQQLRATAPVDAFAWYCAAASRGDRASITQAGLMLSNGEGVASDYTRAANFFQWAADSGDPAGDTCLAECYLYGTGLKKDERHAVDLLQQAVAGGDVRAMNLLGNCYHQGIGTAKNYKEAFDLFTRAHDLGFEDAAGNLGVLYINGDGLPRNLYKAVNLFDEGAHHGSAYCMYLLAKCLDSGTGIASNRFEAEAWYRKAAAAGNPMAISWCNNNHVSIQSASPSP